MENIEFLVRFLSEQFWGVLLALTLGVFGVALFAKLHGISHPDPSSQADRSKHK